MADLLLGRIPVVAGLGYIERIRLLPSTFTAALSPERNNRYFPHAVAVHVNGEKVGFLAPEISRHYFGPLSRREGEPVTCPGRCATVWDHETSGVELLLDFSSLPVVPEE